MYDDLDEIMKAQFELTHKLFNLEDINRTFLYNKLDLYLDSSLQYVCKINNEILAIDITPMLAIIKSIMYLRNKNRNEERKKEAE